MAKIKILSICALFLLLVERGLAQNFDFNPVNIYRELPLDVFSIDQIDITPTYPHDTAYLSYRLIENTCPIEWEFILCDWSDCFINMPNTDDMHPLPNGYDALVKISAHPHMVEGSGYLHFWIFPTGSMDLHESIYFYYHTPGSLSVGNKIKLSISYQCHGNEISIFNAPQENWKLYDLSGRIMDQGKNTSAHFKIEHLNENSDPMILHWPRTGEMLKIITSR